MSNQLEQLKQYTVVVSDSGEFNAIKEFKPQDATTNPSLIYQAVQMQEYQGLLEESIEYAKAQSNDVETQVVDAVDKLFVLFGREILNLIPGRVSTELDARLSYDIEGTLAKADKIVKMYKDIGVDVEKRVLLKLSSTWEGIQAARELEKKNVHCNMTLLFSLPQAIASAEAGATLISPFVGRILDFYKKDTGKDYTPQEDPGVLSVKEIYTYYKKFDYPTIVMGASFRNIGEIQELAGCDYLTIAPKLLKQLHSTTEPLELKLSVQTAREANVQKKSYDEKSFRYDMGRNLMATYKLAEGINKFADDLESLEAIIRKKLTTSTSSSSA